jgi:hypothetical protein
MIRQLFRLSAEIIESISIEETVATFKDMEELGIAEPPYDEFSIEVPVRSVLRVEPRADGELDPKDDWHPNQTMIFNYSKNAPKVSLTSCRTQHYVPDLCEFLRTNLTGYSADLHRREQKLAEDLELRAALLWEALIVLLATKNIVKETKHNSLAKHGVGKAKALYTTSLSIGRVTESAPDTPGTEPGAPKRPHMRRGHIRSQHYGPGGEFVKKVFIQPVFVNADKGYISQRTAYNVHKEHDHGKEPRS